MQNPLTIVIFGATGDLYQNKLSVALYDLFMKGELSEDTSILGFARKPLSDDDFRKFTEESIQKIKNKDNKTLLPDIVSKFLSRIQYVQGNLGNEEDFKKLGRQMGEGDAEKGYCSNKLFYLAVPPMMYEGIFNNIAKAGLTIPCAPGVSGRDEEAPWTRVLVEKPFGKDMEQAERLDKLLGELFQESQIFRIDHYLGKVASQNILNFRFKEKTLEGKWNNKYIDRVRILFHESNTAKNRGSFYDGLGALRDVGQNHMLQMLALVAMENPGDAAPDKIQKARWEVISRTKLLSNRIIRGQYEGFLEEANVDKNSQTETFFRVGLGVENERWEGVPFELESGKALYQSLVLIEVYFKDGTKHEFNISKEKGARDAYEKVLLDSIIGDQTIFTSTEEIMAEWRLITDIIKAWQSVSLKIYSVGTKGGDIN